MQRRPKILIVTAVWGEWHLNALFHVNFPSLLAAGNLPDLALRCELEWCFYTRNAEITHLSSSPIFQEAFRVLPIKMKILVVPEDKLSDPMAGHQWAWTQAANEAKNSGRYVLFLPPDVAWSDNSFSHVADLVLEGKKAILMAFPRVVSDTFVPALQEHYRERTKTIAMPARKMVALTFRHLHPIMVAEFHDSPYYPCHAELILWPVRGEGFLVRVLAREIFLYNPNDVEMTPHFLVGGQHDSRDVVFIDDSEKLFGVSLAPLGKDISWHMQYRQATPLTLAHWWLIFDSPSNDLTANTRIRWHTGAPTAKLWRRQEISSDRLIRDTQVAREGLRVWRAFRAMDCGIAASILALATSVGLLSKTFSNVAPAMILVPLDEALEQIPKESLEEIAKPKNFKHLVAFISRHVVFDSDRGPHDLREHGDESPLSLTARMKNANLFSQGETSEGSSCMSLLNAAGDSLTLEKTGDRLTVNNIEVIEPGYCVGRYIIYKVRGLLDPTLGELLAETKEGR